ncbi:peptide deformylase [Bittarella massiliensis (ex Durand et al. 2017)]|uniref:Peptide deformylase n=1 Tax=Bittarella massiliensis (ex Durand et al. 2017) TaxID=1720313 RepID=A0AAW5KHR1_9FIRM|nr:peptide deformylase [Bittarella massiliensis (ex Durand et al. 2017)]MCQ4950068.1 peptide deformylase [Bittarella massiliensis (ex Durand et al. 2017)]
MALREIRKKGDPLLKKPCREVGEIDGRTRQLLEDMEETLRQVGGAGIAAPQVGVLRRLVVILPWEESGLEQPLFLVNPRLTLAEGEQECVEGCLSNPGWWGKTIRPQRVRVEALDREGTPISIEGEGALAKCLCHELDHLDGVVFWEKAICQVFPQEQK